MASIVPWNEKYRPQRLKDMTQSSNLMDLFSRSIDEKEISHYLFHGPPGTGKTSSILAIGREIFQEHFSQRVFEFNASDDRGINVVRDKITKKAKKAVSPLLCRDGSMSPGYKIIILDEADSMTEEAQDALRVIIEKYSPVTRFCFICNYINKITPAIRSRCSEVFFKKLEPDQMAERLREISNKEEMAVEEEILETIVKVSNGDMRKAITALYNLKSIQDFRRIRNRPLGETPVKDFELLRDIMIDDGSCAEEITPQDIYDMEAAISIEEATAIINQVLNCKKIVEINRIVKEIIGRGKPIDHIMYQISDALITHPKLSDEQRSIIFVYSMQIFTRLKNSASEHVQLLDYLCSIQGVYRKSSCYSVRC